jgi:hypothetical protein
MHLRMRRTIESKPFLLRIVTRLCDASHQSAKLSEPTAPPARLQEASPDLMTINTTEEEMTNELRVLITEGACVVRLKPMSVSSIRSPTSQQRSCSTSHTKNLCSHDALIFHNCLVPRSSEDQKNMASYAERAE